MLGSNNMLGAVIRIDLPKLAKEMGAAASPEAVEGMPKESDDDPLREFALKLPLSHENFLRDAPQFIYRDTGVLIRDGGHFRATFPDQISANTFGQAALRLITTKLPGIRAECRIDGESLTGSATDTSLPVSHPTWQVCQVLGDRPSSQKNSKGQWVSEDEHWLETEGRNIRKNPTEFLSLLNRNAFLDSSNPSLKLDKEPETLDDICTKGYLALIHADGNAVGRRFKAWSSQCQAKGIQREVHAEQFFHSMRVAVRRALCKVLGEVFGSNEVYHHQLLMLGGDDLLIACSAEYAFPFIIAYSKALTELPLADGAPLTIGAGIAIAKSSFPFHRLHQSAEELASSAKKLYRAHPELGSVVDWHISSQSWIDDPLTERITLYGNNSTLGIARPYAISIERPSLLSLEALFNAAEALIASQPARSQLRAFQEILETGNPDAIELAWAEIPSDTLAKLKQAGIERWDTASDSDRTISLMGDVVDLFEMQHLGSSEAAIGNSTTQLGEFTR